MSFLSRIAFTLRYFRRPPWDSGLTPPELLAFLKEHPAGRAIDLGCGTGTNVITLARLGWQVTGVDFASRAIDQAQKKIKQAGVSADLRVGDVTRLDGIDGPFSLVLDLGCFHGLTEKEKGAYLRQLDRILAPGGSWFIYAFLRPPQDLSSPGLSSVDLERISARFVLRSRIDGCERGKHPSAYFIFEKLITDN
jgi:ubiquinone/menaquinone biosynthesis C-methylase UbiE